MNTFLHFFASARLQQKSAAAAHNSKKSQEMQKSAVEQLKD